MNETHISAECRERLEVWVLAHPKPHDDEVYPVFLAGLEIIIEEEVARATARACWRYDRLLGEPCGQ